MASGRLRSYVIVIAALLCAWCGSQGPSPTTKLVREFHERILTVDSACYAAVNLLKSNWDPGIRHRPGKTGSGQIDLRRMKEGGLDAAFFVIPVFNGARTPEGHARARESAMAAIEAVIRMTEAYPDLVCLGLAPQDAYKAEKQGKRTAFLGLGNVRAIGRDLSLLEVFHARGVRLLTLCSDEGNDTCDPATNDRSPEDRGLSEFGRLVVEECNRLGIVVDLAHCPERAFFEALAVTRAPVVVSRSGMRTVCDHPRNMTDDMLRALAENGGTVQISLDPHVLRGERTGKKVSIEDFADHVDHARRLIGTDHVGIATCFDGGGGVERCRDVGELMNVTVALLRRGYGETDVEKIWGGNFMRVFEQVVRLANEKWRDQR